MKLENLKEAAPETTWENPLVVVYGGPKGMDILTHAHLTTAGHIHNFQPSPALARHLKEVGTGDPIAVHTNDGELVFVEMSEHTAKEIQQRGA